MSLQAPVNYAYSLNQGPISAIPFTPIIAQRNPTVHDKAQLGTLWLNQQSQAVWILVEISGNQADWIVITAGSGSGIKTLDGDTGSATGTTVTIAGDGLNVSTAGDEASTITITASVDPTLDNIYLPFSSSGPHGIIFYDDTTGIMIDGQYNTFVGSQAGNIAALNSCQGNTVIGWNAFNAIGSSAVGNVVIGASAVAANSASDLVNCIIIGDGACPRALSGNSHIIIGPSAGGAYGAIGGETNNIIIGNAGVSGDANVMRLGGNNSSQDATTTTYIYGIAGVTVSSSAAVLIDTSTGQLGTVSSSLRYKQNIQNINSVDLLKLNPRQFQFIKYPNEISFGLIAEEVQEIFPELVVKDKEGKPDSIKYHEMPALLLHEIQKLNARIVWLERFSIMAWIRWLWHKIL